MNLVLILLISFQLTLEQAESLAVNNSSDIIVASQEYLSSEAQYRAEVLKFFPTAKITGYIPNITYTSDQINYPSYPNPIEYWKRTEEGILSLDVSLLLPIGSRTSLSYEVSKVNEISSLYDDEYYYQSNILFSLSQPLFGSVSPQSSINYRKNLLERAERNIERTKRRIIREVRSYYIDLYVNVRVYEKLDTMLKLAEREINELQYLYEQGYVDDIEFLRSKGKLGLIVLKTMEIESDIEKLKNELTLLIGTDDFDLSEPPLPLFNGDVVPDIYFDLIDSENDIVEIDRQISDKVKENGPSLEISGYYGLMGKDEEFEAYTELHRNRWGISAGVTIPLIDLPSRRELLSLEHSMNAHIERNRALERELEVDVGEIISKKEELLKKLDIAESTFNASERVLLEGSVQLLSASEQLDILEDYIDAMQYYGSILKELYILDVNFVTTVTTEE